MNGADNAHAGVGGEYLDEEEEEDDDVIGTPFFLVCMGACLAIMITQCTMVSAYAPGYIKCYADIFDYPEEN